MTFSQLNLDQNIHKAISVCGYTNPTPVQATCIPNILAGKDLVASAQTGTGKTAAFVLPALQRLSEKRNVQKPRVLILTPTRELASQITQAAAKYGKFLRFNMASLVGGMSYRQQLRDLSRAVDIVVATPGRLLDHVDNNRLDLSGIEMLILDEADRMLDMGFIEDVQYIANKTPANRQTLLFSATVDDKLSHVVRHLLKNPVRIDLSEQIVSSDLIKQEIYMADNLQHKTKLLQHFLDNGNMFKAIIFAATKIGADQLAFDLRDMGFSAAALHGDLKQSMRNRTVDQLRRGKIQFVVATDVAARGIDISDLTHVINYDLPRFCEDYVHRIGRTGRAGKEGVAISFVLPMEMRHLQRIEKFTGQKLQRHTVQGLEPRKQSMGASDSESGKNKKKSSKKFSDTKNGFSGDKRKRFARDEDRRFAKDQGKRFSDRKESASRGEERRPAKDQGKRFSDRKESASRGEERRSAKVQSKRFSDRRENVSRDEGRRFSDRRESASRFEDKRPAKDQGKRFSDRKQSASRSDDRRFAGKKDDSSRSKAKTFSKSKDSGAKKDFGGFKSRSKPSTKSFSARPKRKD